MTHKSEVSSLIERIRGGEELTRSEHAAADWAALSPELRDDAWLWIQQWISDQDIRERDPEYARMKLVGLEHLLDKIKSEEQARPVK